MDSAIAKRRPLPPWFLEQPALLNGDEFYIRQFNQLSTERQLGMSVGPIPVSKIEERAARAGLDDACTELFVDVIMAMDEGYRDWNTKEGKKQSKRGDNGPKPGGSKRTKVVKKRR